MAPGQRLRAIAGSARRLAGPRGSREAVKGAIDALRRGDQKAFASRARIAVLGPRRVPSVRAALDAATAFANGSSDHPTASERFREAANDRTFSKQSVDVLIALETLARSCGLFAASHEATRHVRAAVGARASQSGDVVDHLRTVVVAIHEGDRERACAHFDATLAHSADSDSRVATLASYLDMWEYPDSVRRRATHETDCVERRIARAASKNGLLVYGPGPTDRLPASCGRDALVVRVMMPEVWVWEGTQDLAEGRSDIAYMNYEAQGWLSGLDPARRDDVLSRFSFFVCKKTDAFVQGFEVPNMRLARSAAALFLSGSENTVPAIVFDLLSFMDEDIWVVGATFFASQVAYRHDSRRLRPKQGVTVNQQGSVGLPFERCSMLASHNALENRALVRNLTLAGRVRGDTDFTEVIGWSDGSYLAHLDAIYGVARI